VRRLRADAFGFACFRTDCTMGRGTGDECISPPGRNRYISRISADAKPILINIINLYGRKRDGLRQISGAHSIVWIFHLAKRLRACPDSLWPDRKP
jgi:hypothetical protein